MPIGKITSSKRGKASIAIALAFAVASGWSTMIGGTAPDTPKEVHAAIEKGYTPPAVRLAVDELIKPWEGLHLVAYKDMVGVWTICWGETKGVLPGMRKTVAECEAMLIARVTNDYYLPLIDKVSGFAAAPVGVQASMTSLAYNVGQAGASKSTAAKWVRMGNFKAACSAITAWNKAGGRVVKGLVNRREMGDVQRKGEAEICLSGL